ncbi:GNAT family N-acetyltransferase [Streptococcus sp. DD13]|uniref:GNAT family N-acetyltransferase n=1 Tax=Streptococcus sp. DD13 TaxID=1777881 RepID=UPI00079BB5A1|nr:GNAT family N-acetyltransferase [Streptococcus sp. DD13]KXT79176.1 Histone acetyltransferase HPA2 or related acetyltransferase [Streptococcus sp. DD13]
MSIRLATFSDIPRLQELLGQILHVHHEARPDIFKSRGSKYSNKELQILLEQAHTPIFVYENEDGVLLGHLFVTLKEVDPASTALQPIKTLFIEDLCVDAQARGKKIGDRLLQFAETYARDQQCYNLTLNVWNDNTAALRFYERHDMHPQETVMEKILSKKESE